MQLQEWATLLNGYSAQIDQHSMEPLKEKNLNTHYPAETIEDHRI